jgi:hypothetical protein
MMFVGNHQPTFLNSIREPFDSLYFTTCVPLSVPCEHCVFNSRNLRY